MEALVIQTDSNSYEAKNIKAEIQTCTYMEYQMPQKRKERKTFEESFGN